MKQFTQYERSRLYLGEKLIHQATASIQYVLYYSTEHNQFRVDTIKENSKVVFTNEIINPDLIMIVVLSHAPFKEWKWKTMEEL